MLLPPFMRWWRQIAALAAALVLCWLLRRVLWALLVQLLAAYALVALALPLCRLLEKHLSPTLAAVCAFAAWGLGALALAALLIPALAQQFRQISDALPALLAHGRSLLAQLDAFVQQRGLDLSPMREELFAHLGQQAAGMFSAAAKAASAFIAAAGKLFLAPLFAFYLLRDRRKIVAGLVLFLPVRHRARAVRAAREMRRETAAFLRGQVWVSGVVGLLTALGLWITGSPAWLLLGLFMGVMELLPYVGPLLAGVPAVLLALQRGFIPALWTLGVLVLVQQLEGSVLSPRLLSGATRLHPLAVLLTISAGGMLGGTLGMLLALPLLVSLRGALRSLRSASPILHG